MINESLSQDFIIQYSADGVHYWESTWNPEQHVNQALYPNVLLQGHKYMRIIRSNSTNPDGPMRIIPVDAYNIIISLIDDVVYWRYTNEDDSLWKVLFKPKDYAVKGDKGERGASLNIDFFDYKDNIGLYTPSINEINSVSASCVPCNMESYDTIYREGTKIFMSMGQNENDNTGAGEIYAFSYNKKTWIKLPGILSPTGELKMSLTGHLRYLNELLDLDVFKINGELFTLKEQGVNAEHISDITFGYGMQKIINNGIKWGININDFIGFGIEAYTENIVGPGTGNLRFRVDPKSFISEGKGLIVTEVNDTNNEGKRYDVIVSAPDILFPLGGLETENTTNQFKRIKLKLDTEFYLNDTTGALKLSVNNTNVYKQTDNKIGIKPTEDDDAGLTGVTKLHLHFNVVNALKGLAKDPITKQFYIKVDQNDFVFTDTGYLKIKEASIRYIDLDVDNIFDSDKGFGINNNKVIIKLSNSLEFTQNGELNIKESILSEYILNNAVKNIKVGVDELKGIVAFSGSETNNTITDVLIHQDTVVIKTTIKDEYSDSIVNLVLNKLQNIDLISGSQSLMILNNEILNLKLNKANKLHTHSLTDINENENLLKSGIVYAGKIAFNNNGLWLKIGNSNNFANITLSETGEIIPNIVDIMIEDVNGNLVLPN